MYTLLKPHKVRELLHNKGITIFSVRDFILLFNTSRQSAKYYLESWTNNQFLIRLKKGLYSLSSNVPAEEEIANKLYIPSYVSFEYALSYYRLIPETVYSITSATTKPTRTFSIQNKIFSYRTLKNQVFSNYILEKKNGYSFYIAEKEKALVDYFYFVVLHKISENERLNAQLQDKHFFSLHTIDKTKLRTIIDQFNHKGLLSYTSKLL